MKVKQKQQTLTKKTNIFCCFCLIINELLCHEVGKDAARWAEIKASLKLLFLKF